MSSLYGDVDRRCAALNPIKEAARDVIATAMAMAEERNNMGVRVEDNSNCHWLTLTAAVD